MSPLSIEMFLKPPDSSYQNFGFLKRSFYKSTAPSGFNETLA